MDFLGEKDYIRVILKELQTSILRDSDNAFLHFVSKDTSGWASWWDLLMSHSPPSRHCRKKGGGGYRTELLEWDKEGGLNSSFLKSCVMKWVQCWTKSREFNCSHYQEAQSMIAHRVVREIRLRMAPWRKHWKWYFCHSSLNLLSAPPPKKSIREQKKGVTNHYKPVQLVNQPLTLYRFTFEQAAKMHFRPIPIQGQLIESSTSTRHLEISCFYSLSPDNQDSCFVELIL